jgi:hypothetical protein
VLLGEIREFREIHMDIQTQMIVMMTIEEDVFLLNLFQVNHQ